LNIFPQVDNRITAFYGVLERLREKGREDGSVLTGTGTWDLQTARHPPETSQEGKGLTYYRRLVYFKNTLQLGFPFLL
jgi:hypothetical protein